MTRRPRHGRSWPIRPLERERFFPAIETRFVEPGGPPQPEKRDPLLRLAWRVDRQCVEVWVYAVPSARRAELRAELLEVVIPEVLRLHDEAEHAGEGWRLLPHEAYWFCEHGEFRREVAW